MSMACRTEVAVHVVSTVLFVALLCGPAAVYEYLSHYKISNKGTSFNSSSTSSQQCSPVPYTSGACLAPLQACVGGGAVMISSSVDVPSHEQQASVVMALLKADVTCQAASQRFLCQYLFPLCDDNGTLYGPTYQECLDISEGVCREEWGLAPSANIPLPMCTNLPNTASVCSGNTSAGAAPPPGPTPLCSDTYYFNGSVCLAQCGVWQQYAPSVGRGVVVTELLAAAFGCGSQLVLMVLFVHQWRRMSKFPSVFMIYHTICYFIIVIFVVINHSVPYADLFCSRKSVIDTYAAPPTVFCTISGVVLQYFFVSMCWWWLFHIAGVFWMLVFPYHAKVHVVQVRYLHGGLVVGGILLPLPGVIVALATEGYSMGRHPPLLCMTKDPRVFYYSVVLLTSGILATGLSMLVVLYWTLYRHYRSLQGSTVGEGEGDDRRLKRLLAVLTYYVLFGILAITQQSLELGQYPHLTAALQETFLCQALGGRSCPTHYQEYSYPAFGDVVYLLMGLIPTANMVFVLPAWQLWRCVHRDRRRQDAMATTATKDSISSATDL